MSRKDTRMKRRHDAGVRNGVAKGGPATEERGRQHVAQTPQPNHGPATEDTGLTGPDLATSPPRLRHNVTQLHSPVHLTRPLLTTRSTPPSPSSNFSSRSFMISNFSSGLRTLVKALRKVSDRVSRMPCGARGPSSMPVLVDEELPLAAEEVCMCISTCCGCARGA